MGVLTDVGRACGTFLDELFSLERFEGAGKRAGATADALVGGALALAALGLRVAGRVVLAALRRGARTVRSLRAQDLVALGISAGAAALLVRTKVWQLLTVAGLLVLAGLLRRRREEEQQRLVGLLAGLDDAGRQAFLEAANRGDVAGAGAVLGGRSSARL
jgi:hypothetical protein